MQKIPMHELTLQVNQITRRYQTSQIQEKMDAIHYFTSRQRPEQGKSAHQLFIEAFEIALNALMPHHRMIIYNDFIQKSFHFWWEHKYARSTYYRQKYRALEQFASYFTSL
ncbi:MAG: hypothetical protein WC399_01940 [Bacilli bacterium]